MSGLRDSVVHGVMGVVGIGCAALSGIAFVIAAIVSATLGILAFVLSPLRAAADRLRP